MKMKEKTKKLIMKTEIGEKIVKYRSHRIDNKIRKKRAIESGKEVGIENNDYCLNLPNVSFYLPWYKKDLIQQKIIINRNYFEKSYLDFVTKEYKEGAIQKEILDSCVLDIGSNIGNHALYFLKEMKAKKVYCFEPIAETFNVLKRNIEINNLQNRAVLINKAVGNCESTATISKFDKNNCGGTTLNYKENGDLSVITIDGLNIPEKVGFIKIDVEGFEMKALEGMKNLILRDKPYIMIEIQNNNLDGVISLLKSMRYEFYHYNNLDYIFSPL